MEFERVKSVVTFAKLNHLLPFEMNMNTFMGENQEMWSFAKSMIELVKEDEFQTQFMLSACIALFYGFLAYYSKKYCSDLPLETKGKRYLLAHLMSIYFSATVFMCSVAQWISSMYHYVKYGNVNLETKVIEIGMIYACSQAIVWDTIMGMEYYPEILKYRILKYVIYMGTAIYSLFTNDSKLVIFVWLGEYPDLLKEHTRYMGFRIEKIDQTIYQMVYVAFKILFPMVMLYHYYIHEPQLSQTLLSIYFLCTWFDVVQLTVWMFESTFMKNIEKEKTEEVKKNK